MNTYDIVVMCVAMKHVAIILTCTKLSQTKQTNKKLSYGYAFKKNFNLYCSNKWENHVYYVINILNNLQDFNKGNGIKKDYKEILKINE